MRSGVRLRPGAVDADTRGGSTFAPTTRGRRRASTVPAPGAHSPALSACVACGKTPVYQGECCCYALISVDVITRAGDIIAEHGSDFDAALRQVIRTRHWVHALEGCDVCCAYWSLVAATITQLRVVMS